MSIQSGSVDIDVINNIFNRNGTFIKEITDPIGNASIAIVILSSGNILFSNNIVSDNFLGMEVQQDAFSVNIFDNVFSNNSGFSILISSSSSVEVVENQVTGTKKSIFRDQREAIKIFGSSVLVQDNNISKNKTNALSIETDPFSGSFVDIIDNSIVDNSGVGVVCDNDASIVISGCGNTISNNKDEIESCSTDILEPCVVENNTSSN